jgi:hypothetical protein
VSPTLAVIDPAALTSARARERSAMIRDLQARTRPGGVHLLLPTAAQRQVIPLAPESFQALYDGWQVQRRRRGTEATGFVAIKPAERQPDTALNVSD